MVTVNDKEMNWKEGMTVEDAVVFAEYHEYYFPILIVSKNGVHVKFENFKTTPLDDGDDIRIMQSLDGG
jgi:thiamine biosynthesis protein ThiS